MFHETSHPGFGKQSQCHFDTVHRNFLLSAQSHHTVVVAGQRCVGRLGSVGMSMKAAAANSPRHRGDFHPDLAAKAEERKEVHDRQYSAHLRSDVWRARTNPLVTRWLRMISKCVRLLRDRRFSPRHQDIGMFCSKNSILNKAVPGSSLDREGTNK